MPARFRARVTYANVVATVALIAALGGGALAAASFIGPDGQIHGCVDKKGRLTVVRAGKGCAKGQNSVAWNQRGPRGPRGPGATQFEQGVPVGKNQAVTAAVNGVVVEGVCQEGPGIMLTSADGKTALEVHGLVAEGSNLRAVNSSTQPAVDVANRKDVSTAYGDVNAKGLPGKWTHFSIQAVHNGTYCVFSGLITPPSE